MRIKSVKARQIINSQGIPTLEVEISTHRNTAVSSVPIAATKSKYEFRDVYDHEIKRLKEDNLTMIIDSIHRIVAPELVGQNAMDQEHLDDLLLKIDDSIERNRLGIYTITAISQTVAKLGALESDLPLFKYIRVLHDYSDRSNFKLHSEYRLPLPVITIYRSASHSTQNILPAQEVMIFPKNGFDYQKHLIQIFKFIQTLDLDDTRHNLKTFLEDLTKQIIKSKVKLDLGVDMAASRYRRSDNDSYVIPNLTRNNTNFNGEPHALLSKYLDIIRNTRLSFLEDFFAEDDYYAWKELVDQTSGIRQNMQIVSDDFTATNQERLEKVALLESANNIVFKPTQIGTVTEIIYFALRARKHGLNLTGSYRYGETEDTFIVDLSVGLGAEYIRTGYYKGSEYNCKLNRLLQIAQSL